LKLFSLIALITALLLAAPPAEAASFSLHPKVIGQGKTILARASLDADQGPVEMKFLGKSFPLYPTPGGEYVGLVACSAKAQAGVYPIRLYQAGEVKAGARITVKPVDYGVRRITVDPKYMELTKAQLARYRREVKLIRAAYATKSHSRLWKGGFLRPTSSVVVSKFGRRSIVNGQERSPHSGVDLRGKVGDEVRAPAKGRVVLVLDSFFGGLMVALDHGQGLFTNYLHLSKSLVKQGEPVEKGQVFALIGKSGRVTGPHLHFGVLLQGVKVDPLPFVDLTGTWARQMGD
jgi:murein DD-endopeptidase MepM/ murein hydrolase activator NlpD